MSKEVQGEKLAGKVGDDMEETNPRRVEINVVEDMERVDQTPTPKASHVEVHCKLALGSINNIVATATVIKTNDPLLVCQGKPLGEENWRVSVSHPLNERALIPIPVGDEIRTVVQACGSWVAWPKKFVVFDEHVADMEVQEKVAEVLVQEVEEVAVEEKPANDKKEKCDKSVCRYDFGSVPDTLPKSLKQLCEHSQGFAERESIRFEIEEKVFGVQHTTYMMDFDILRLAQMDLLTGNCIVVYMRCLFDVLKHSKMEDMIGFSDPATVGADSGTATRRITALTKRLISAKEGQMLLMPYFESKHWMLLLIDCENEVVYCMDPATRRMLTGEGRNIVDTSISKFNDQRNNKKSKLKWRNIGGIPKQPGGGIQCAYYVMQLMRDNVYDKELAFAAKWERRERRGNEFTVDDIDQVRDEVASYLLANHVKL